MSKRLIRIAVLAFLGVILVILPLVGCDEDDEITAEHLAEKITAAAEDMETYQFDMEYTIEIKHEIDEGVEVYKASVEVSAVVDTTNKKIQITNNSFNDDTLVAKMEEYFIGDMFYTRITTSAGSGTWRKAPGTFEFESWLEGNANYVVEQLELLKASEIESFNSESVNSVECWVIKVIPNLEQLWEIGRMITAEEVPTDLGECMKDISVKQWFAKDTYYLMGAELEWTVLLSAESLFTIELECSNNNEPVSIELPPEAEELN